MNRSRGVALIIALVIVALATIFASRIGAEGALDQRRAATLLAQEQSLEVAYGAEDWVIETLQQDAQQSQQVTLNQMWAMPMPTLPIDGGEVTGRVEDLGGRFNVNNLVTAQGTKNVFAFDWFQRLLIRLQIEPKWASLLLDWIDPDNVADGPDGAEDGVYLGLNPPYRPPNRPIATTTELLSLPGFGLERYRKLQPFIAALPVGTPLNVCTANGVVLESLAPSLSAFAQDPKLLMSYRAKGCFPTLRDVTTAIQSTLQPAEKTAAAGLLAETSAWFRLTTSVRIGTTEVTLYSLLQRNPAGQSRVVLRSFGTE
jgi:general secretion pathway protein K